MSRGGLVYVKRDLSHEDAPRTFDREQGSALTPWIKWSKLALSSADTPLPEAPQIIPKGVPRNVRAAARHAFLGHLHTCGQLPVERHVQIIKTLAPALGWPWEGVDGSVHMASPSESWLASKEDVDISQKNGWLEWATASVMLMKDPLVARSFLPMSTIVQPWNEKEEKAQWCYGLLEKRWKNGSEVSPSIAQRQAAGRLDALLAAIDDRLHYNPSPLGLPLHWQVAVRQLEKCVFAHAGKRLDPLENMDSLPPIHTHTRVAGTMRSLWMGVSEWALLRFANMVHASKDWPEDAWGHFKGVIERDMDTRDISSISLLLPFREHLLAGVEKFVLTDKTTGMRSPDRRRIDRCKAEVDGWWLECLASKPSQSMPSSRPRRL